MEVVRDQESGARERKEKLSLIPRYYSLSTRVEE